jgi:hypothetical protein
LPKLPSVGMSRERQVDLDVVQDPRDVREACSGFLSGAQQTFPVLLVPMGGGVAIHQLWLRRLDGAEEGMGRIVVGSL